MTPDIVVDIGNSRMKWGRREPDRVGRMAALPHGQPDRWAVKLAGWGFDRPVTWAVAGVHPGHLRTFAEWATDRGDAVVSIDDYRQIDLRVAVDEPEKVGVDRLVTALAARRRTPSGPVAVVNVGTAVTVDFVADNTFLGGAILPGPRLMARALHTHTAKLPFVRPTQHPPDRYLGTNTTDAIEVGIQAAVIGTAEHLIFGFGVEHEDPTVYLTGGGLGYFGSHEFTSAVREVVFDARLTLDGIRIAAEGRP